MKMQDHRPHSRTNVINIWFYFKSHPILKTPVLQFLQTLDLDKVIEVGPKARECMIRHMLGVSSIMDESYVHSCNVVDSLMTFIAPF